MADSKGWIVSLFEVLFLFFIASFFLTLGLDDPDQMRSRMGVGVFLLGSFFLCLRKRFDPFKSLTALGFLSFFVFGILRWLWAVWQINLRYPGENRVLLFSYLSSPLLWSFYLGFFALSLTLFSRRSRVERLLWLLSWCGFLLAINVIPPLLIRGHVGYPLGDGRSVVFHPLFYSPPFVAKYVVSRFGHPNYTGDVIALGLFPAASLFVYSLRQRGGKNRLSLGLLATFVGATALAVVLLFSRGTILSFSIGFLLYLLAGLIKFPSRRQLIFSGVVFSAVFIFLVWAGNLPAVWKEIQTLRLETREVEGGTSFSTNREGARRALAIYRDYPLWGVGTDGYPLVSEKYASRGSESFYMAKVRAMCHYLQVLAEEGMGAFLYFFFLSAYFFEVVRGLWGTESRFQFMAGLSLFSAIVMILIHSTFNHLMQQFSIAMLVYIYMGASLGVLRRDFRRD